MAGGYSDQLGSEYSVSIQGKAPVAECERAEKQNVAGLSGTGAYTASAYAEKAEKE